ncbi:MAG: hypothetical protein MUE42_06855 [Opitutaceae bacterium]|jgi:hypothetical protein|nr:hypothetical protein [Opitutaceae bacterium]
MSEREQLIVLCEKLGAEPQQAATMADQLLKRCTQLETERGWPRLRAMEHLLGLLVKGRAGETVPGFEGGRPPE